MLKYCTIFFYSIEWRSYGDVGDTFGINEESNDVVNIQFLDRIHSYLLHSNVNIAEEDQLYHHVMQNNEDQIEQTLSRFQQFRIKRQKELDQCHIDLANNTKFVTEIEEEKEPNLPPPPHSQSDAKS